MRRMRQWCTVTVMVVLFCATTAALAQSPQGMKLYVFSSGALTIGKNILQNLGPTDTIQVPVGFFVAERNLKIIRANVDGRETFGRWQVGGTCQVEIGQPFKLEPMANGAQAYRQQRRLTDRLMGEIAVLVQQAEVRA